MQYYIVSTFLNGIVFILLGTFVYFKNRQRTVNRVYLFFSLAVAEWAFAYFFWLVLGKDHDTALFWSRVLNIGPTLIPVFFFHYILALCDLVKPNKKILIWTYVLGGVFFISSFTPLYVRDAVPQGLFIYYPAAGVIHPFFLVFFFGIPVYSAVLMFRAYPHASLIQRLQIKYLLLCILLGFGGGGSNFFLMYNVHFPPIFNIGAATFPLILAYLIIRYRVMEIDTVVHRTALWVLTSCLVLIPIGVMLYFLRSWFTTLNWLQLTFLMTGLFYLFLFYYRKMQPRIDHFFRRRKYDYYQVLSEISQKIGSELDINSVITRLFNELKEILYIRNGLVLVQQPGGLDYTEAGNIGYKKPEGAANREVIELDRQSGLAKWLQEHKRCVEKEQIEIDPQYESIKEEALIFLRKNSVEVLIPVFMEDRVNALIGIGKKDNLQAYTTKDIELLENMGRQIGITIDNAMHHEDIVEKERLAEEMRLGRDIQMALLPRDAPQIPGLVVDGLMQPAKEIGGDYYDFITLPQKDQIAVVIGDVSGKGVAAGLLMAMAKTAIHTLSQEQISPKEILLRTNAILNKHIGGQKFMTLLYLRWQYPVLSFAYSSAGHEHILIHRKEVPAASGGDAAGVIEAIISGGFMLGMLPKIDTFLEEKQIELAPGDKVLLYTDGATEAEDQSGDRFGLERLKESFLKHSRLGAHDLMTAVKEDVYAFIGAHPQYDDITLVVLEAQ
jgi:serine phosphatase RsbU (regulator of sigma subunit)